MHADAVTIPRLTDVGPRPAEDEVKEKARETPPEPVSFGSFAERLLGRDSASTERWQDEGRRLAIGLGLAALFGVSLGLRAGGMSLLTHAVGVAAGFTAVAGVAAPSFAIILALVNAPVTGHTLARATSGAVARAGLILGGLAPAAALYVVTVEDAITVTIIAFSALLLAGLIGAAAFARELRGPLLLASETTRRWMHVAMPAFLLFSGLLAFRVWCVALPVLSGAR